MHRLIEEEAGHPAVAEMMRFADHSPSRSPDVLHFFLANVTV
jgi:hypothetical protein